MGLDIGVYNEPKIWENVGSYSSVHYLRNLFIKSAIKWSEQNNHDDVKELLKPWLHDKFSICYEKIPQFCPSRLNELDLAGLYWFVNHSDCDGGWSVGQCNDIIFFYQLMDNNGYIEKANYDRLGKIMYVFEAACLLRKCVVCF